MKWNDVRNNFQKTVSSITELSDKDKINSESIHKVYTTQKNRNQIMIGGIFLVIIIACIAVFLFILSSRKNSEGVTQEQSVFIENFLEENNPEPISPEQETAISELLNSDFAGFEN